MNPVLTEAELAELLRLPPIVVDRLLSETDVPRLLIAGRVRFIAEDVVAWLRDQASPVLREQTAPASAATTAPGSAGTLAAAPPAAEGETPFVSFDELLALAEGAGEPAENLTRQRLRDALIALGDELQPTLTRSSRARLHPYPEEAHRTSRWRVDPGGEASIDRLVMPFGEGEPGRLSAGQVGYGDRPRVELVLTSGQLTVRVSVPPDFKVDERHPVVVRALGAGAACPPQPEGDWALEFSRPLAPRAPTQHALATEVRQRLELLIPVWLQASSAPTVEP